MTDGSALLEPSALPELPGEVAVYKRTPSFDEDSVPKGLTREHRTRAGVWGRIVVEAGALIYAILDTDLDPGSGSGSKCWRLEPGLPGIIEPTQGHEVRMIGPVRFHVEFLKELE